MPPNTNEQGDSMIRIILILFFAWITTVQAEIVTIEKRGVADDIIKCEWEN